MTAINQVSIPCDRESHKCNACSILVEEDVGMGAVGRCVDVDGHRGGGIYVVRDIKD